MPYLCIDRHNHKYYKPINPYCKGVRGNWGNVCDWFSIHGFILESKWFFDFYACFRVFLCIISYFMHLYLFLCIVMHFYYYKMH